MIGADALQNAVGVFAADAGETERDAYLGGIVRPASDIVEAGKAKTAAGVSQRSGHKIEKDDRRRSPGDADAIWGRKGKFDIETFRISDRIALAHKGEIGVPGVRLRHPDNPLGTIGKAADPGRRRRAGGDGLPRIDRPDAGAGDSDGRKTQAEEL